MFLLKIALWCCCALAAWAQIDDANKLNCRLCDNAPNLGNCKKIAVCDKTYEECYMDEIITEQLTIVYNAGCRAKDVCEGTAPAVTGRKKREELIACSRCCNRNDTDGCNKRLCGIPNPTANERQCYSCSSDQPDSEQGEVKKPEDCVSFKICQHDEVCYARSHVTAGKVTFEYGCHSNASCVILMNKMIQDKARCEANNYELCGDVESLYCFTCCGWGGCNYGTCKDQNSNIYALHKNSLFDNKTLDKLGDLSTTVQPPSSAATTTKATTTTQPIVASTTTQAPTVASTTVASTTVQAPTVASTTVKAPTVASTTVQAPTVASTTVQAPTVASTTLKAPTVASTTVQAPTVASTTVQAPTVASTTTTP